MTRGENRDGRSQANAHIARSALTSRSRRHRREEWPRVLSSPLLSSSRASINETWSIDDTAILYPILRTKERIRAYSCTRGFYFGSRFFARPRFRPRPGFAWLGADRAPGPSRNRYRFASSFAMEQRLLRRGEITRGEVESWSDRGQVQDSFFFSYLTFVLILIHSFFSWFPVSTSSNSSFHTRVVLLIVDYPIIDNFLLNVIHRNSSVWHRVMYNIRSRTRLNSSIYSDFSRARTYIREKERKIRDERMRSKGLRVPRAWQA